MVQVTKLKIPLKQPIARRHVMWPLTVLTIVIFSMLIFLLQVKITSYAEIETNTVNPNTAAVVTPFPISVNPQTKIITENTAINLYLDTSIASNHTNAKTPAGFFAMLSSKLARLNWYQNLATPINRTLVINSGERNEEVTENFAGILRWNAKKQADFITRMREEAPLVENGTMYPGKYTITKDATPEDVARLVADRFNAEIRTRYTGDIETVVPLKDALIIASLLEREAYDFEDMRYISGVIWNRLFIDMRLQIDATLQYARGGKNNERWWPIPVPADKYLKSPFNTYQNAGLPPEPISNPSIDAVIAALNPRQTDCLFYFHDNDGTFYCSKTYEDHVSGLRKVFGTK